MGLNNLRCDCNHNHYHNNSPLVFRLECSQSPIQATLAIKFFFNDKFLLMTFVSLNGFVALYLADLLLVYFA